MGGKFQLDNQLITRSRFNYKLPQSAEPIKIGRPMTEAPSLECSFCLKTFSSNSKRKRHEKEICVSNSNRENVHRCTEEGCSKVFTQARYLRDHLKQGHGNTFSCTVGDCSKVFSHKCSLKRHTEKHRWWLSFIIS